MRKKLELENERISNELIDNILFVTFVILAPGFILVFARSLEFTWGLREALQLLANFGVIFAILRRNHLRAPTKLFILLASLIVIALSGIYTLGPLGASVFFLPATTVLAAIFFSRKHLILYLAFSIGALILAAILFVYGIQAVENADIFLTRPLVWAVYLSGFIYLVLTSSYAVYKYRTLNQMLQSELAAQHDLLRDRSDELEKANKEIKTLQGIIPICSYCHKIRDESDSWDQLEEYISSRSKAKFSHGICPSCAKQVFDDINS